MSNLEKESGLFEGFREKFEAFQKAREVHDSEIYEKLGKELANYIIEARKMDRSVIDLLSPAEQSLIFEAEENNWDLHAKPDWKEQDRILNASAEDLLEDSLADEAERLTKNKLRN